MLEEGVTATNYTISYSNTDSNCFTDSSTGIITDRMSYYLSGLEEDTEYIVTVIATLSDGEMWMGSVSATTMTAGVYHTSIYCPSIPISNTVPSSPPSSVAVLVKSPTTITVHWGPVDCRHQNGEITGYSVRYGEVGSDEEDRTVKMVLGDSSGGMTTISTLNKETVYTVEVAAETSAGTGVYSDFQTIQTPSGELIYTFFFCCIF